MSDSAIIELLPCPFCGGTDVGREHVSTYSLDSSYETFGCRSCWAVFVNGSAEEWNRRANATIARCGWIESWPAIALMWASLIAYIFFGGAV